MDTALRLLLFEDPRSLPSPPYSQKVLDLAPANLIAYWRFNEDSGSVAVNHEGTAARDGTYIGVTLGQPGIGDGLTAALFDGVNDVVDVHSASLNTAFDGNEGTVAGWFRVSGASVWTDGTFRHCFQWRIDAANQIYMSKPSGNDEWSFVREGGNLVDILNHESFSPTDWFHSAITYSDAGDINRYYIDGLEVGSDTGIGTWAGNLSTTQTVIGATDNTPSANVWDGFLAHMTVFDTPLSAAQILELATL